MEPKSTPQSTPSPTPRRRRSPWRWPRRALLSASLLTGAYFLITDSFLTRWVVVSQLGARLGGNASASSVTIFRDGRVALHSLELRAPGVEGEGGVIFRARQIIARVELSSLLSGRLAIQSVDIDQPLARLSQSLDDRSVNLASLRPAGSSGPVVVPRMIVSGGVIELGEHSRLPGHLAFTSLRRIPVAGEVDRARASSGEMKIAFHELDPSGQPLAGPGGLQVEGAISKDAISLNLGVLNLSNWPPESVPQPLREIYAGLALEGQVYGAELTYTFAGAVEARANLSGVAVTLPVDARPDPSAPSASPPRRLRMQDVQGSLLIRNAGLVANLDGLLEELQYHVELDYKGSSTDAPFSGMMRCANFELRQRPEILRFAPERVRERLAQFSDPTGVLDAEIHLERAAPAGGKPAEVVVTGTLDFRKTTAAFTRFPYRFYNMSGRVSFDPQQVVIDQIKGDAPGGVTMSARVVVAPPTEDAAVDVDVIVNNLPIDDTLRAAMRQRIALLDAVFNTSRYQELIDLGLIVPPERASEATPQRPVFALTGRANVRTHVHSPPGKESPWHDRVEIQIIDAGMLPERVPYPVLAQGVTVIKEDDSLIISGGSYTGLKGGSLKLHAQADVAALLDPSRPAAPDLEALATGLPLDPLLINAIPRTQGLTRIALAERLRSLNLSGDLNFAVRLGTKDNDLDYRVQIDASECLALPMGPTGSPRVALRGIDGSIDASPDQVLVDLSGRVTPPAASPATGRTAIKFSLLGGDLDTRVQTDQLDLALPFEDLVRAAAPEAADQIAALRRERSPSGAVDAIVHVTQPGSANAAADDFQPAPKVDILLAKATDASVDAVDGRVGVTLDSGRIRLSWPSGPASPALAAFDQAQGSFTYDHQNDGQFHIAGAIQSNGLPGPEGGALSVKLTDARFECGLLRQAAASVASVGLASFLDHSNPRGRFNLDLALASTPDRSSWEARGSMAPTSLTLNFDGTDVAFPAISGRLEFDGASGRIDHLQARAPEWTLSADGSFLRADDKSTHLEAALFLDAARFAPDLAAILPGALRQAATDLAIGVSQRLHVPGLQLRLSIDPQGQLGDLSVDGSAEVDGLTLDPGVLIENANGLIDFSARRSGAAPVAYELFGILPAARVGGVSMTQARVRLAGAPSGEIILPQFSAACHGGKITGDVTVGPSPTSGPPSPRSYQVAVRASGVRFASLLQDWAATPAREEPPFDPALPPDQSRGELDANFSLAGIIGEASARRGRGSGTIAGGKILSLPLIIPLVRVGNLELPVDEPLDFASAEFFVQGPLINFEQVSIFSQSVQISGFGTLEWPGMALDMRFRPRARNRIPLITSMVEGIRDELLAAQVQGTLTSPQVEMKTLTGTTRFVGRIFGQSATEQQRRLDRIEAQSRLSQPARPVDRNAVDPK